MGAHPNVILMAVLKPDNLSRKTMRDIKSTNDVDSLSGDILFERTDKAFHSDYHTLIMEDDYDESWQISADEGDLVFFKYLTYGYGESFLWEDLVESKTSLEAWAKDMSSRHHCSYTIKVSANYW